MCVSLLGATKIYLVLRGGRSRQQSTIRVTQIRKGVYLLVYWCRFLLFWTSTNRWYTNLDCICVSCCLNFSLCFRRTQYLCCVSALIHICQGPQQILWCGKIKFCHEINSVMWRFVVICKLLCGETIAKIVPVEKNFEICDIFKT